MPEHIDTLGRKATVTLAPEVAAAVDRQRERVAEMTGAMPSVAMVLQGALHRAVERGLLGDLPEPRANRAG